MRTNILIIGVLSLILSVNIFAQKKALSKWEFSPETKFDSTRDAQKDLEDAVAAAKRMHKLVYVDIGGEWCIWCKRLDNFYESNRDLYNYLMKHYIYVKINYSKENKNEEVLSKFPKIEGYPHIFILNKHGKLIKSKNTGELEEGKSYNHGKIKLFLKEWVKKS
jgi:thioredoxin-related protein